METKKFFSHKKIRSITLSGHFSILKENFLDITSKENKHHDIIFDDSNFDTINPSYDNKFVLTKHNRKFFNSPNASLLK